MKPQSIPVRLFIYTADVQAITGRSKTYCRHLLKIIRQANKKPARIPISVFEFCRFMNLDIEQIQPYLH